MGLPIIGDLITGVKDLISEVVVDKDKRDQVNLELAKLQDQAQARLDNALIAQIDVNKVEASSGSLFVAGWRPAVGWVGAFGLAYNAIIEPFASWIARVFGYPGNFPATNNELLLYILGGMLGLGGLRSFEKVKGVATNDMTAGSPPPGKVTTTETKTTEVETKKDPPVFKPGGPHFKI